MQGARATGEVRCEAFKADTVVRLRAASKPIPHQADYSYATSSLTQAQSKLFNESIAPAAAKAPCATSCSHHGTKFSVTATSLPTTLVKIFEVHTLPRTFLARTRVGDTPQRLSKKARRAAAHVYGALPNDVLCFLVLFLLLISPFDLDLGEAVYYWLGMGHLPFGEVLRLGFSVSRQ